VGNFVAGKIGEATGGQTGVMSKAGTLAIYNQIGWITIALSAVVLALAPLVKRWMHLTTLEDRVSPADQAAVWGGDGEREQADVGLPSRG
jgi:POT family proton-dependent oligopeptide transporter